MAELAGIIISGVGLVALESTVEEVWSKISTWRHHGEDYEKLSLDLELANLAYHRWRQTVKLVDSNQQIGSLDLPVASDGETKTVERLLGAISVAFQDVEETSKRYETNPDKSGSPMEVDEKKSATEILTARVRAANKARQTSTGGLGKLRWVFHDKKALETLVERVSKNVESLVKLFPAATQSKQSQLAIRELAQIVPPDEENYSYERQQLVQVLEVTKKVDPILQASAAEKIKKADERHNYFKIRADGHGRIFNGDHIALGATAPQGPGHSYDDIHASGNSRIHNGDRVGMEDPMM